MFAITLISADLNASMRFYEAVFEKSPTYQDEVSTVYQFGNVLLNLLAESQAQELFDPIKPGETRQAPRTLLTIQVESVDDELQRLDALGIEIASRPIDRSWGIRTLNISDPDGNIWELSQDL